jgi:hypothetical protein
MIRQFLLALTILLAPSRVALAQMATVEDLNGRLDPRTATAVRSLIDSAIVEGMPSEPLVAKALEGESKGAPGERIVSAVRNLASGLAVARASLGTASTSSELVAGAGALRSGASTGVLSRLREVQGKQSVLLPLATLTDLIARGIPVERAAATVLALAERGANEADYRSEMSSNRGRGRAVGKPMGAGGTGPAVPSARPPGAGPPSTPPRVTEPGPR